MLYNSYFGLYKLAFVCYVGFGNRLDLLAIIDFRNVNMYLLYYCYLYIDNTRLINCNYFRQCSVNLS